MVRIDILVLFLILGESSPFFTTEYDVGCGFFIYGLYYAEVCSLQNLLILRVCIVSGCYTWSNAFSASVEMIWWFLSFPLLLMWCVMLIDLQILTHHCILGINPTWSWWMIFFFNVYFFWERVRERARKNGWGRGRERETEDLKWALCGEQMNQTVRSWPEPLRCLDEWFF